MLTGILLALLAAIGVGCSDVFTRRALYHFPLGLLMLIVVSIIFLITTILTIISSGPAVYSSISMTVVYGVTAMALLGYIAGQSLHFFALRKSGVTIVTGLLSATPLIALVLAVTIGGERPNVPTIMGGLLIMLGASIVLSERRNTQV